MDKISFSHKISTKLVFAIILVFIVVNIIASIYQYYFINKKNFNECKNNNETTLMEINHAINDWGNDKVGIAKLIARSDIIKDIFINPNDKNLLKEAKEFLDNTIKDYPYYTEISIINLDRDNNIEYASKILSTAKIEQINKYIQDIINNISKGAPFYFGSAYKEKNIDNVVFPLGVPIYNNDKLIGAVIIKSRVDRFLKYLKQGYLETLNPSLPKKCVKY